MSFNCLPNHVVGESPFGLTPEIMATISNLQKTVKTLFENVGEEKAKEDILVLYDGIKRLESQGLRGLDLFLAIGRDHQLVKLYSTYFYVVNKIAGWGELISKVLNTEGEIVPPKDLIVGDSEFGITEETILQDAEGRIQDSQILSEEGFETIISKTKLLYDAIVAFEQRGLRNETLDEEIAKNDELLKISKRYYGFIRRRIWGYRVYQNVGWRES